MYAGGYCFRKTMKKKVTVFVSLVLFFIFNCSVISYIKSTFLPITKWSYHLGVDADKQISGDIALDRNSNIYVSQNGIPGYSNGRLLALNQNGIKRWEFAVRNFSLSNPVIDESGNIFIHSSPSLYALDNNGTLLWELEELPNLCQLVLGSNQILYGSDCLKGAYTRKIWSVSSSGKILWSTAFENISKLTLDGDNNLYLFHFDRFEKETYLICLFENSGLIRWKYLLQDETTNKTGIAIFSDNSLLVNLKNSLILIKNDGQVIWEKKDFSSKSIPLINEDNIAFALESKTNILYYFRLDGSIIKKIDGNYEPIFLTKNQQLHCISNQNQHESSLTAFDSEGVNQWMLLLGPIKSSPAVANDGTIVVFFKEHLVAIQGSSSLLERGWPKPNHDNQNTNCYGSIMKPDSYKKKLIIEMTIGSSIANINGFPHKTDPPFIEKNRAYLPFRLLGEYIGATVEFSANEQTKQVETVSYMTPWKCITLFINKNNVLINGLSYLLDAPPVIRNNKTFIPLRFVAESLGAMVKWESKTQTITIFYED